MANKRLVRMPVQQRQAQPAPAIPPVPIAPTFGNSWPLFLWLVATATALYFAKWPILVVAAIVGFCKAWIWLSRRYPRTMYFIAVFIAALIGGRRRR
jgi:hypothetical protein